MIKVSDEMTLLWPFNPSLESITSRSTHAWPCFVQSASSILHLNDHVTALSDLVYTKVALGTSVSLLVLAGKLIIQRRKSVNSIEDIPRFPEVYDIMEIFLLLFIADVRKTMEDRPKTEKRKIILQLCDFIRNLMKLTNKLLRQLEN